MFGTISVDKSLCTLHPPTLAVILSGLGVQGAVLLGFLSVFLCTPKPDIANKTRHPCTPKNLRKCPYFLVIRRVSA
jgi:hypothetical protein